LTTKTPYKGLGADSEEKHVPVSDIETVVVDSLKALDLKRPIREADVTRTSSFGGDWGRHGGADREQHRHPPGLTREQFARERR